jgi:uncharacterized protein (TIGR03435 family)
MPVSKLTILMFVGLSIVCAQTFDVASIRTVRTAGGEGSARSKIEYSPGDLMMSNVTLQDCVQWAWNLKFFQVEGSTSIDGDRYDIQAKSTTAAPIDQLRLMLQDLLQKRFKMISHRAQKTMSVYELVVAKGGSKLPAPKTESGTSTPHTRESLPRVSGGDFLFQDASMADFAEKLSELRTIEAPVIDKTGIPGTYDIRLRSAASALLEKDGVSLFTLLPEQLGLRLAQAKSPVEILVIDSAERPSEN